MEALSRKSYREVVRKLEHYRQQHEEDIRQNPNRTPLDWKSSLSAMIESVVRGNKERYSKGQADLALKYLKERGLLIDCYGGYTFPGTILPSREEVKTMVLKEFNNATK